MLKKILCLGALAAVFGASAAALQVDLAVGFNARNTSASGAFPQFEVAASHEFAGFKAFLDMYATTDGIYPAPESQFGGLYVLIKEGGLSYEDKLFKFKGGQFRQSDLSDSPYSLFISSKKNSAFGLDLNFDDGTFFYETRWIQLNNNSALFRQDVQVAGGGGGTVSIPFDRGVNYRNLGVRLGDFRVAYMESDIYTGRSFDWQYFLLPIPGYFTQYIRSAAGAPWQESKPWDASSAANDNFITGLLVDYRHDRWYGVFQWLLDDVNLNAIIKPSGPQNPNKWAMQAGARYRSDIGTFGLFSAFAFQYTYQPVGSGTDDSRYGYTYYPAVEAGGRIIPQSDNNVGYVNGENSLAFMLQYANAFAGLGVNASLEFVLTGTQSPANPWATLTDWQQGGQGTRWLGDPVLEKKLSLTVGLAYDIKPFTFRVDLMGGYVWNRLELTDAGDGGNRLWSPSADSGFIGSFTLTAVWHLGDNPKPADTSVTQ